MYQAVAAENDIGAPPRCWMRSLSAGARPRLKYYILNSQSAEDCFPMGCWKIGIARVRLICGESIAVDGLLGNISDYRTASKSQGSSTKRGSRSASLAIDYSSGSSENVRSVDREMGEEFHFPFSSRDLIFGIARRSPNVHWALNWDRLWRC